MAGPKAAANKAGSGNGSSNIPPSDRKLVASLKEVVPHSDEEIYAMFKECNRDPDETVQRLLSQETFHVVKSKRDKKKEPSRDTSDNRASSGSSVYARSGRSSGSFGGSGMGRGSSLPRSNAAEANGVRSKMSVGRGNGTFPTHKVPGSESTGALSYSQLVQPKSLINDDHFKAGEQPTRQFSLQESWPATSVPAAPTLQGAWLGSGRGTVADLLKSKTSSGIANTAIPTSTIPSRQTDQQPTMNMQLAPSDPVLNPVLNPSVVVKREVGAVGNQRHVTDRSAYAVSDVPSCLPNTVPSTIERDLDSFASQISNSAASLSVEDQNKNSDAFVDNTSHVLGVTDEVPEVGNPVINGSVYTSEQVTEQLGYADDNSQSPTNEEQVVEAVSACTIRDEPLSLTELSATTGRLQELNMRENKPIIIPDHIRISESDCTMLSFGSFGSSFEELPSSIAIEESIRFESSEGPAVDQSSQAVAAETVSCNVAETTSTADLNQEQQSFSDSVHNDDPVADVTAQNDEHLRKEENAEQNLHQHTSYPSIHQVDANNFASEPVETRPQDNINAVLQPYDNSTYYSGMFRTAPEVDSRYSSFLPGPSPKLVTPNRAVTASSSPASSHEASSATAFAGSASVGGQTVQVMNNSSSMALPQQSLPIYATQPSGLPLGPFTNVFSYPYMPPGFSYLQNPYQHNYMGNMGTGNYHQVPSAVAGAGMKYPVPQYKTSGAVGGMHTAYGTYTNSQPGSFPVNPSVTSGSSSNFDDNASQQFKEANVYMPNQHQQMDAHSMWLQSQLGRDLQGSSYYNVSVPNQNQQARYSQTQSLLAHAHPGAVYGNLYQQQSGSTPGAHQMLQQQPNVGSVGSLGTQIGSYQQAQRSQQTWANGF